ncbi:hypothetical protein DL95DRAFT_384328 [Leptodontidium sp. 2 PMI_412]|nr:hypothetical protein DL95DRAFT_384328 [Leptodontidium sp. 2 PMI_412]
MCLTQMTLGFCNPLRRARDKTLCSRLSRILYIYLIKIGLAGHVASISVFRCFPKKIKLLRSHIG